MSHASNCLRMLMILNSKGLVQAQELSEMLEVSTRMVRKYRTDLEMAGIQIGTKPGRYGGYFLEKKSVLPNIEFQEKEITALNMAFDYIQNSKYFPEKDAFKMLFHHISSMSIYKEEVDKYLYFIHKSKPRNTLTKDNELFLKLRSAILENKKVIISYQGWRGELESRKIHPYGLIHYNSYWYCRAFCEKRDGQRTFKLLRMKDLLETNEEFIPDENFNIREDRMGICDDEHHVELKVFDAFTHTISESIWGENQEIIENPDGSVTFKAKMFGKESIIKWILGMGRGVIVIGPEEIRSRVREEIQDTLKYY
ncbi:MULTISPECIES: helix-turn-helix transcriptional regulator [Bacillus]|uniref:helix-turn-helix transcriptional regulator n=1 Tax=Bacillus TaxID=1386 RepID=UPI000314F270|nr:MULTISPECIES: WYL domain-containing protein [Bacillus]